MDLFELLETGAVMALQALAIAAGTVAVLGLAVLAPAAIRRRLADRKHAPAR